MRKSANVPTVAQFSRANGRPSTFGWSRLREVGEDLLVMPDEAATARAAASSYKARHPGWDYTSKAMPDGRVRFTRTA